MKTRLPFFLILTVLLTTGAGCISFKSSEVSGNGGVWTTADAGATWVASSTVPTPEGTSTISGGNVTALHFDPSDPDAVYLGTRENGLFYSYDNGAGWMRVKEEALRTGWIRVVAVDPSDKCTVYVAKGNNVMKSTDCARTWDLETFVETNGKIILSLSVDWFNPQIVWIGTEAGDVVKSTDGGATWSTLARVKDEVVHLMVSNADSRIVLAATEGKGLWRTTDGGATWTRLEDELKSFQDSEDGYLLSQDKAGTVMYFANKYGLLKSVDSGATWEGLTLVTKPRSVHIYSLAVNPDDGNNVFYGTATTFYASTDGGASWSTRELPSTRYATALAVDPNAVGTVFLGSSTIEE